MNRQQYLDASYRQSIQDAKADITTRKNWTNDRLLDYLIPYAELFYCDDGWAEPGFGYIWWPEYGKAFPHVMWVRSELVGPFFEALKGKPSAMLDMAAELTRQHYSPAARYATLRLLHGGQSEVAVVDYMVLRVQRPGATDAATAMWGEKDGTITWLGRCVGPHGERRLRPTLAAWS